MSEDEDDYLSDKFLVDTTAAPSSQTKTYSQRRKEAERIAALKNAQNRKKSRKELEVESREEGLSKSLFERAKEDEASGSGQNKALAMMMKMGFKPGQTLGKTDEDDTEANTSTIPSEDATENPEVHLGKRKASEALGDEQSDTPSSHARHRAVPLPLNEWAGRAKLRTNRNSLTHGFICNCRQEGYWLEQTSSVSRCLGTSGQDGQDG